MSRRTRSTSTPPPSRYRLRRRLNTDMLSDSDISISDLSSGDGSEESDENEATDLILQLCGSADALQAHPDQWQAAVPTGTHPVNFSVQLLQHFECFGDIQVLQNGIYILEGFLRSTSSRDKQYRAALSNIVTAYLQRFKRLDELDDLEQALSKGRQAVDLTPNGHANKPGCLSNLAASFVARFERLGDVDDLESAILRFKDAVDLTPNGHPDRSDYLANLGSAFLTRFERLGDIGDLENAISRQSDAVELTPGSHPDKPGRLANLGCSFRARFERLGDPDDLETAISRQKHAIELTPDSHPDKPVRLTSLGNSLRARFVHLGEIVDLENAIAKFRNAIELTPDDHPHKSGYLTNLGSSFLTRFEHLGDLDDLQNAILIQTDAVELTPNDHPHKSSCLMNLGNSFLTRFERLGDIGDLENAILRHSNAVELSPDDHPNKPTCLTNLGTSFIARFERLGDITDLENAILKFKNVIELTPNDHPEIPGYLKTLGSSFLSRFERLRDMGDLENAILRQRDAVELTSDSHPDKPGRLESLGGSFFTRFEHFGDVGDLENAIFRYKDAIELIPNGHPQKPAHLVNLGNSFLTRFERLGDIGDLENAIVRQKDAVELTPDDHPNKSDRLINLGSSLLARFERLGNVDDLESAISRYRDAVELAPNDHPHKPAYLTNLGTSFLARFQYLEDIGDLENAISKFRDAVSLAPDGHPDKPGCLTSLGVSLFARFERLGDADDLENAILRQRDAVEFIPDGHIDKPASLLNFGNSFRARFERTGEVGSLQEAITIYSRAACASGGRPSIRLLAARCWVSCAHIAQHSSLLEGYACAIDLLPQMAWIGSPLADRSRELLDGADIAREAAAAALDSGDLSSAVEWLEQGRSVIWGELFQLRRSYEELESVHAGYAQQLRQLSIELDHGEKSTSSKTLEKEADKHRTLALRRDELLREIRKLPGFERFLLRKEFSQLRDAAHSGPVVILNAASSRCDALIVLAELDGPLHVPLPNFTLKRLEALQTSLKNILHMREGKPLQVDRTKNWKAILSALWRLVVKPILDALALSSFGKLSRIFWCPTGPFTFFPIHAAGLYDEEHLQPGHKLSDFTVSSYIPTLSILASSSVQETLATNTSSKNFCFLAVPQPASDGLNPLPGVNDELGYIAEAIQNLSAETIFQVSSSGTVEEVLGLMKEADWVHFACHGTQDNEKPTGSGLCLADGRRLTMSDMISLSRPRGGLAFLSACETAMGDRALSDEAIHIAAGMLFAGYEGVIATMWPISDRIAPHVAHVMYKQLFRKDVRPDTREAARALQDAVGRIRNGGASFEEWLPFIHVGF